MALWVKERPWAHKQKIKMRTSVSAVIDFTSIQYDKVFEWLLSSGQSARPLATDCLVRDWRENIKGMRGKVVGWVQV
jgi:hypothetical protein